MHKKSKLILSLSLVLIITFSNNVSIQNASAQDVIDSPKVFMIGVQMELKNKDQNYYFDLNHTQVYQVQNDTDAKYIASFVNQESEPAVLHTFDVLYYNFTTASKAEHVFTYTYDTSSPTKISVPSNGTYTEVFNHPTNFTLLDRPYLIQYQFSYNLFSNATKIYNVESPFNFSLRSQFPLYNPPEFVIWTWWAINFIILVQFLIGWYGNRKIRKQNNSNN